MVTTNDSTSTSTSTTGAAAATSPLNVLDELYLHLDRPDEPWSVHLEIRVAGRLERTALEAAVRTAAAAHPLARAQLAPARGSDVRYRWDIAAELGDLDLTEIEATTPGALDEARAALLSRIPDLSRPGPFALLLAHTHGDTDAGDTDAGDTLVLNLHHAAGDGISAMRLMTSIARAYSGEPDETPAVDPLAVRDVAALVAPSGLKERLIRQKEALTFLGRGFDAPTRIVADGASDRAGYGFLQTRLTPDETSRLTDLRSGGATLNDVLLAGLAVAVRRWNTEHDVASQSIYLMMPVNLRPASWRYDVVGNFASYVTVRFGAEDSADCGAAVLAAAAATRRIKESGIPGMMVDLVWSPSQLPTAVKQRLQELIPFVGDVVVDTAVLSNLGRVDALPDFGDAGAVQQVFFSPPGRMPLGASFGVATVDGQLSVTLRYRPALFDAAAAGRFLQLFHDVLAAD